MVTHYLRWQVRLMAISCIAIVHVVKDRSKASLPLVPSLDRLDEVVNHQVPPSQPDNIVKGYNLLLNALQPSNIQTYLKLAFSVWRLLQYTHYHVSIQGKLTQLSLLTILYWWV